MNFQIVEKLSLNEQFRLVEIAHESSDSDIRKAALAVLRQYLNPIVMYVGEDGGWLPVESAPKDKPIQVWAYAEGHHWLPLTAVNESIGWTRPACGEKLPYEPTYWRELPGPPVSARSRDRT